jgi:hypothetical protein
MDKGRGPFTVAVDGWTIHTHAGERVQLDVMGRKSQFPVTAGPG